MLAYAARRPPLILLPAAMLLITAYMYAAAMPRERYAATLCAAMFYMHTDFHTLPVFAYAYADAERHAAFVTLFRFFLLPFDAHAFFASPAFTPCRRRFFAMRRYAAFRCHDAISCHAAFRRCCCA